MTQGEDQTIQKSAELAAIFVTLDEAKQDSVFRILRALEFAQSILCEHSQPNESY